MGNNFAIFQGDLWVSKHWLLNNGVTYAAIHKWIERQSCKQKRIEAAQYFLFSEIPKQTRKNLPSAEELKTIALNQQPNTFYTSLYNAVSKNSAKYIMQLRKQDIPEHLLIEFSKKAAALETSLTFNTVGNGKLQSLTEAICKIFPGWINSKNVLCNILSKARLGGVLNAAIDKRKLATTSGAKFDELIKQRAAYYYCSGKAYTADQVITYLQDELKQFGLQIPKRRTIYYWFKEFEKNFELYSSRYGNEKAFNHIEPYISTIPALHPNDQWQADGVDLPFHAKGYQKYTLFFVQDAHSKKIIGYSIAETENTTMILQAFNDAVCNAGALPFEIKMDNHSYNRTLEGQNFKAETEALGVHWTISHNPRHKSIIERTNKTLSEQFFKLHKGYIGQGIKTRNKGGRTSQELLDKYHKSNHWVTKDEIISIAVSVVDKFNNSIHSRLIDSPENLYTTQKPNEIPLISLGTRIKLFTKKTEKKVVRGQITIVRSGVKYEYQLNAALYAKYNGSTVAIRYEDLDTIYVFDKKTDGFIDSISQKPKIHGALANQTEADREILNKHKGRLQGIRTQARKKNELLTDSVLKNSANALQVLNPITTPKDVLKEVQQNYQLKAKAEELGVNFNKAEKSLPVDEFPLPSLKPQQANKKSPFAIRNHVPTIVSSDYMRED